MALTSGQEETLLRAQTALWSLAGDAKTAAELGDVIIALKRDGGRAETYREIRSLLASGIHNPATEHEPGTQAVIAWLDQMLAPLPNA